MDKCDHVVEYITADYLIKSYNQVSLNLSYYDIRSIKKISSVYTYISLNSNCLKTLPPLHDNIESLEINRNNFYILPKDVLKVRWRLDVGSNKLNFINKPLADSVYIHFNNITRIDHIKDKALVYEYNQITYPINNTCVSNNPIELTQDSNSFNIKKKDLIEPFYIAMLNYLTATSSITNDHYLRPWNINFILF